MKKRFKTEICYGCNGIGFINNKPKIEGTDYYSGKLGKRCPYCDMEGYIKTEVK